MTIGEKDYAIYDKSCLKEGRYGYGNGISGF